MTTHLKITGFDVTVSADEVLPFGIGLGKVFGGMFHNGRIYHISGCGSGHAVRGVF